MVEAEVSNVNSAEKLILYRWEFISTLPNSKIVLEALNSLLSHLL